MESRPHQVAQKKSIGGSKEKKTRPYSYSRSAGPPDDREPGPGSKDFILSMDTVDSGDAARLAGGGGASLSHLPLQEVLALKADLSSIRSVGTDGLRGCSRIPLNFNCVSCNLTPVPCCSLHCPGHKYLTVPSYSLWY